MLRRRGMPAVAYFGFKRNAEGQIEGHAWVKSQGIVVAGMGFSAIQRQYNVSLGVCIRVGAPMKNGL